MKTKSRLFLLLALLFSALNLLAQTSGFQKLDEWVEVWKTGRQTYFGYPANQQSEMSDFYKWYLSAGMEVVNLNNAGDPMTDKPWRMSSHAFERDVIEYFAPLYGFTRDNVWGIVTHSGTDGNNHLDVKVLFLKDAADDGFVGDEDIVAAVKDKLFDVKTRVFE